MTTANPSKPQRTGLTLEQKTALAEATAMRANGATVEAAVNHLVACGMPSVVAKVLLKQYDRTSESSLIKSAIPNGDSHIAS